MFQFCTALKSIVLPEHGSTAAGSSRLMATVIYACAVCAACMSTPPQSQASGSSANQPLTVTVSETSSSPTPALPVHIIVPPQQPVVQVAASDPVLQQHRLGESQQAPPKESELRERIRFLITALASKGGADSQENARRSGQAMADLIAIGSPAVPDILAAIADERWGVARVSFITALRGISPPSEQIVLPLTSACGDKEGMVRLSAVFTLGGLGTAAKDALPALIQCQSDANEMVRDAADKAVRLIDQELAGGQLSDAQRSRIAALIADLRLRDARNSTKATSALAEIGRIAVPMLLEALQSETDQIARFQMFYALQSMGKQAAEAVPALLALLESGRDVDRAADVLAAVGPDAAVAVAALMRLLDSPDALVMRVDSLVDALGRIGVAAQPHVPSILAHCDVEGSYRRESRARALASIASTDPGAIVEIGKGLEHPSPNVRCVAARALASIGAPAGICAASLIRETSAGNAEVRRSALLALRKIGLSSNDLVDALILTLGDEEVAIRSLSIETLASMGPVAKQAVPALVACSANDESRRMRRAATVAVRAISPGTEMPSLPSGPPFPDWNTLAPQSDEERALIKRVDELAEEQMISVVQNADDKRLARVGKPVVPFLVAALTHRSDRVRYRAVHILGLIGASAADALPYLVWLLEHDDSIVRSYAAEAISEIGIPATSELRQQMISAYLPLLSDEESHVRSNALEALTELEVRDARLVSVLRTRAIDEEFLVRERAIRLLGHLGPMAKEVVPVLVAILERFARTARPGYEEAPNAEASAFALERIGAAAKDALPALRRALAASGLSSVRAALTRAIKKIEDATH